MWKHSRYTGAPVPFSTVLPEDDSLHPVGHDAHYTSIETNLYGFNIPGENINCNIYLLWHPALKTMSMHLFVFRGERILGHQLESDYIVDYQYLPAVEDNRDFTLQLGTCTARLRINTPLDDITIDVEDKPRNFSLNLKYRAAMAPVGRPGGKHFTQLMKTSGDLVLDGRHYPIDGYYMRDRSWSYTRPEQPERTPPYRWITGWDEPGTGTGFVVAWMDTSLIEGEEFGPNWNKVVGGVDGTGQNKWESGGPTPSLNLRSGWVSVDGQPRPVVDLDVRTLQDDQNRMMVRAIEITMIDDQGDSHKVTGELVSLIPKMYWQTMLVHMHMIKLTYVGPDGVVKHGHGDLMDTYSSDQMRALKRA